MGLCGASLRHCSHHAAADEATLVAFAKLGDEGAFEELVRRRQSWLRNPLARLSGDDALANDLAQQAFLRVWQELGRLKTNRAFGSWLRRMAANLWFNHVRIQDPVAVVNFNHSAIIGFARSPRWLAKSMLSVLCSFLLTLSSVLRSRTAFQVEILALRHQIGVLRRSANKRPKLTVADRVFWAWLSGVWADWRSALVIVKPETVIGWHRKGFRLFWTWKVRHGTAGRPMVSREVRDLIRTMSRANPLRVAPRIHGELLKLGIDIGETSVGKYMIRHRKPPTQAWRTFLENHLRQLVSVDFFTVPTIRFQVLYVFLVLAHERRRILHFNVTAHPTSECTAQQLRNAFPWDSAPRYLLRDRDRIFGDNFTRQVQDMGIEQVLSAPRSPWQRAYVERIIGTIRRECLDHVIIFNEAALYRQVKSFAEYYHRSRTHLSLSKDSPESRAVQSPKLGRIVSIQQVGGLHHRYERRAA
jgi:putative transposase